MISIEIEILGKKYRFKSDEPKKLKEYADNLNDLLKEVTEEYNLIDGRDILSLAGMRLTEKVLLISKENEELRQKIAELSDILSNFLAEASE